MSFESVMPSNHLLLYRPLLLLPSIFPSIRVFSNGLSLWIRWPKYWSFSFSINPCKEWRFSYCIYITNFCFHSLVFGEIFYMICFIAQGVIYLDTWAVGKNVSCSILLVFYAEFFSAFADFMSSFSISIERKVLMSLTQFWFCPFLFLVLLGFSLMCFVDPLYGAHIEVSCLIGGFSLLSLQWPFLSLVIFFALKTIVSDNDNDLLWLIFKW